MHPVPTILPILLPIILLASQASSAAVEPPTQTPVAAPTLAAWQFEYDEIAGQLARLKTADAHRRQRLTAEALDPQALVQPSDADPLDAVLRRSNALLQWYKAAGSLDPATLAGYAAQLEHLAAAATAPSPAEARRQGFLDACALRRSLAFANPLLDFNNIVCMLEQPGDARIIEQARAIWHGHSTGGGPLLIANFKTDATPGTPLSGIKVAAGPWQGKTLTGKFSGLELSYNGNELLFAATTAGEIWHLFKYNLTTKLLEQLTDGPADDFDPCLLPSGRIVFTSTRRSGVGRCLLTPQSLTYTLHSMAADGSDIVCLSFHETNEWAPSVTHSGKIAYTRWDYVDRHWGTAHHFWESFPDGRDPRNYHGNYPLPWSSMTPGLQPDHYGHGGQINGRVLRPDVEMGFRAIAGSQKYTATAVGHHEGFSGSLVLLDPRVPDDGMMAQLKRITPEYAFPEVEGGSHTYGTPWPLSEDFYLCNFNAGLYLLDRFGNRELIHESADKRFRVRDAFPLRPRPSPPVLPTLTWQGERASQPDHKRAVISVMNVYSSDAVGKLPEGIKVKWLRIVQVIPQMLDDQFTKESVSQVSFATDAIGRMPLGVVPVEEDGSVYCEAPVGKAIFFQLLDEKGMAVQSMRSATYVHPGESLSCMGCHEDKWKPQSNYAPPMAMLRAPSKLVPEVTSGAMPFNYIQLVKQPVFDRQCVACHAKHPGAPDMSYASLARNDRAFSYAGETPLNTLGLGGSRTAPANFGARASGLMKTLTTTKSHKDLPLSPDDWRRITLWLDLNSNEIGWIGNDRSQIAAQKAGAALWPPVDVDPARPTGVEIEFPAPAAR